MYQLFEDGKWLMVNEAAGTYGVYLEAYNPVMHRIIGCAMRVHALPGRRFPEVIYQRALAIELEREQLTARREIETDIYFRGQRIGSRCVDFPVEGPFSEQRILVN
jgi:hypothetical protein